MVTALPLTSKAVLTFPRVVATTNVFPLAEGEGGFCIGMEMIRTFFSILAVIVFSLEKLKLIGVDNITLDVASLRATTTKLVNRLIGIGIETIGRLVAFLHDIDNEPLRFQNELADLQELQTVWGKAP